MRWHLVAAIAAMFVMACSASTTVGSGTGAAGGSGSSGTSSSGGGMDCSSFCAHLLSAGCGVPTQSDCLSGCQQAAQQCPSEAASAAACAEGQTVFCDSTDSASVAGCDAEVAAVQRCANGASGSSSGTSSGSSGSSSGSSTGASIPPGGSCAQNADGCTPIQCTCKDGATFGPISLCVNDVCEGTSDGCTMLCSNDGGW